MAKAKSSSGSQRAFDVLLALFFFIHIPITILVDAQIVLPKSWYPQILLDLSAWYTRTHLDHLVEKPPLWFTCLCWCELLVQFPFFFVGATMHWKGSGSWYRLPAIVYGAHVSTTMVPILAEFALAGTLSLVQRATLIGIYAPFLVFPLALMLRMLFWPGPFASDRSASKKAV
eukprot:jgi/Mesvir1/1181/Mv17677-RA.1